VNKLINQFFIYIYILIILSILFLHMGHFPFNIFLHRFLKSDPDDVHDHPWPYATLIIKGGYYEWTPIFDADGPFEKYPINENEEEWVELTEEKMNELFGKEGHQEEVADEGLQDYIKSMQEEQNE
jgi:hypothetical protein